MDTERFKFNARPGEPGYKEVGKNQYGHTVLSSNENPSTLDDKVNFRLDAETGESRAEISIWDTQQMKDLAQKYQMPLDNEDDVVDSGLPNSNAQDKDMDDLLKDIEEGLDTQFGEATLPTDGALSLDDTTVYTDRVRKISKNKFTDENLFTQVDSSTKRCTDEDCSTILPRNAKFCSVCGKPQQITIFCVECGRKFNEREKFCADCGYPR